MKSKIVAALFAFATIFTSACERQRWSDTQKLFKGHEEHGAAHDEKAGEHGKTETHSEKKADEHGAKKEH
jgi:hypothetical protein